MKLIIDIDEEARNELFDIANNGRDISLSLQNTMIMAIANGTPLPKGHGRLIDEDNIIECAEMADDSFEWGVYVVKMKYIRDMPTVIEADKGE